MQVTDLVAKELGLQNYSAGLPQVSLNGVTTVELESKGTYYRIYLVKDAQQDNVPLEEGAKLAAFYNSKFFYETLTFSKLGVPCGKYVWGIKIEDNNTDYSIFVVEYEKGFSKCTLSIDELCELAEHLAKLHAVNPGLEFLTCVRENHENIKVYQDGLTSKLIKILEDALQGELARYFRLPQEIMSKISVIMNISANEDNEANNNFVICHGQLTADHCYFQGPSNSVNHELKSSNTNKEKLVEIREWEHVHFADAAFDLSNLIISSADSSVRRNNFMKIFRHYFYTLVDMKAPRFKLVDLKSLFRKHHKDAVIRRIEYLLEVLANSTDESLKYMLAERWESALDDAYYYTTDSYVSDDEHCFFSK